jgi:predicted nuclease with TOPRIM domain
MTESLLRKITFLLLVSAAVCFVWAVGATARKKVELGKSETLQNKLSTMIRANTVITNDLKQSYNKLAVLKKTEQELYSKLEQKNKSLAEAQENKTSAKELDELRKDTENLRNANMLLGEEMIKLKEKEISLQQELRSMIEELESIRSATVTRKKPEQQNAPAAKAKKEIPESKNFGW